MNSALSVGRAGPLGQPDREDKSGLLGRPVAAEREQQRCGVPGGRALPGILRALVGVLLLAASLASSFAESSFTGLGFLPGGSNSLASAVSGDGKVVVGASATFSTYETFCWTAERGMIGLGLLPGEKDASAAYGVSSDGKVIVGVGFVEKGYQAFRWTAAKGMVGLGALPTVNSNSIGSIASAVSGDGKVVVGISSVRSNDQAFRWTAGSGMVGLPHLHPGSHSQAHAVSGDGSVIVGSCLSDLGYEAFRWTATGGTIGLGCLRGNFGTDATATAVSSDGKVIVGKSFGKPFRWTAAGGMIALGTVPSGTDSSPRAVSGDGSVIVGGPLGRWGDEKHFVWIWDSVHGIRNLQLVLINDYHLDLTGWELVAAKGISFDGKIIVGDGVHNGHEEAWIAHLDWSVNEAGKGRRK